MGKAARGTRAHSILQASITDAAGDIAEKYKKYGITVRAEVFKDPAGVVLDPNVRSSGSLGLDIVVYRNKTRILAFELKTGRNWSQPGIDKTRERFRNKRYGKLSIVEVFVNRKF